MVEIAGKILKSIRKSDTAARLGGDEFTVVAPFVSSADEAKTIASKINEMVSIPITLKNEERQLSASIGVSIYPDDGDKAGTLLEIADAGMYKIKREMKNSG